MTKTDDEGTEPSRWQSARDKHAELSARLTAFTSDLGVRDTFRALFQQGLSDARAGWPRRVGAGSLARWLRRGDLLVELARSPRGEPFEFGVLLPAERATGLVDCLLGGTANSGMASASGAPSEAECGVLAYAAARLAASFCEGWRVRHVRVIEQPEHPGLPDDLIVWPAAFETSLGSIEASLLLTPALADALRETYLLELLVRDHCAPELLAQLTPGDVLVSDSWTLTSTSAGLSGDLSARLPATDGELRVRLASGSVVGVGLAERASGRLELLLAELEVRLVELAELAAGGALAPGELAPLPVLLRDGERAVALGDLVLWQGAIGVRIRELLAGSV